MDQKYKELSERILIRAGGSTDSSYSGYNSTLTLISGPPGSGKSTLAKNVAELVNNRYSQSPNLLSELKNSETINRCDTTISCDITRHPIYSQLFSKIPDCETNNSFQGFGISEYPLFLSNQSVSKPFETNRFDLFSLDENHIINFVPIRKHLSSDKSSIIISRRSISNSIKISLLKYPKHTEHLNKNQTSNTTSKHGNTIVIPMDGFHYPKSLFVPESPVSEILMRRRGCPASFDAYMVVKLVEILKFLTNFSYEANTSPQLSSTYFEISIPSFNHEDKDPKRDGIIIRTDIHKNFIMEGLYLSLLQMEPWCEISRIMQQARNETMRKGHNSFESWFIKAKIRGKVIDISSELDEETKVYLNRVGKRHLEAGLVNSLAEGYSRFLNNDLLNCELIMKNYNSTEGNNIDLTVESVEV